jgi:hypothetical protein
MNKNGLKIANERQIVVLAKIKVTYNYRLLSGIHFEYEEKSCLKRWKNIAC